MVELTVTVAVDADVEQTWRAAIDWPRQGDWIPLTDVRVTQGDGSAVGDRVVARTAIGPIGFDDLMEITAIEPPRRCDVVHLGRVVRGTGVFAVAPRPAGGSRFTWTERLDLPLGGFGRAGFLVIRPLAVLALRFALRRFARHAAATTSSG
jgi:polyketide cyclase/dehydrase/lipid transport protein